MLNAICRMVVLVLCLTSYLSSVAYAEDPASVAKLPIENFANLPDVSYVSLSPSGEKVVSLIRVDLENSKGSAVQVANLESGEKKVVLFNDNTEYFIYWLRWKDDRTLLAGYFYPYKKGRYESRETRMFIIDTETGEVRTPFRKVSLKTNPVVQDRLVDILPDDPDHILVEIPTTFNRKTISVFRLNINNKRLRKVHKAESNVWRWKTDQQHVVRYGHYAHRNDGVIKSRLKRPSDGKWLELWPYKRFSDESVQVIGFGVDPNDVYIRAYHKGLLAVFKVDLNDSDLKRELVYADPKYDVGGGLLYSSITKEVVGLSQEKADGGRGVGGYVFFDPDLKALQRKIDKALPDTSNKILSFSKDMQTYLVFASSDVDSGSYLVGNRKKGSLGVLAFRYKNLLPEQMSMKKSIAYTARDGLEIEAFITLPKGEKTKKLPTIVFAKLGVARRDSGSFSYWTQYFANRGYAVFQPFFRGSGGLGVDLLQAGLKSWGKEMQDDIEDGVNKLIADGIADESNICIVGLGYGGYAALMGVSKTPDLYKCAVSVNGISNVYDFVKRRRAATSNYNVIDEVIGNDNRHLRDISPVNHVKKIKVPVLLAHSGDNRAIDIEQSFTMNKKLKKHGKNVEYIELPNEDHFLSNGESRVKLFSKIDEFLEKNMPVDHMDNM